MPSDNDVLSNLTSVSNLEPDQRLLPPLPFQPSVSANHLNQLSPAALAYLGDAVYELYVRQACLLPPKRIRVYHRQVVAQVRAEAQARQLQILTPQLTPDEVEWLRRGRNSTTGGSRRVEPEIYQQATSLETLVGYLYLTNPQRLLDLLNQLDMTATVDV